MRTCAENGVVSWNAQLMVGKSVDKSIKTYINHASLRKDAEKVLRVLQMEEVKETSGISNLEEMANVFSKILVRLLLKEMRPEDLRDLNVNQLLTSESIPVKKLQIMLERLIKYEENYSVDSRGGRIDYWKKKRKERREKVRKSE